jgi:biopolymer transport protein ExbD
LRIEVPRRRPAGIRLTPLIDVVFILLVFFMLASSFVDWRGFDLGLPAADATPDPAIDAVIVTVDETGRYRLNGEVVAADALATRVSAARGGDSERPVVVRAAEEASVEATLKALDRLHGGGIAAATLAEQPR